MTTEALTETADVLAMQLGQHLRRDRDQRDDAWLQLLVIMAELQRREG